MEHCYERSSISPSSTPKSASAPCHPAKFMALQNRVFPAYFRAQVGLALLTATTRPPFGLVSLYQQRPSWGALPLVTGALNWLVYGPRTVKAVAERARVVQEQRQQQQDNSGCPSKDAAEPTKHANRVFARNHVMSIHLNAIAMLATVGYAFESAPRITFAA